MPRGSHGGLAVVPGLVGCGDVEGCPAHADYDYLSACFIAGLWLARLDDGGQGRRGGRRIAATERNGVQYWMEATAPRLGREYCLALRPVSSTTWEGDVRVIGGRTRRVST